MSYYRSATEMRPGEITEARDKSSCAFIAISPAFEWHSYHLPMGVDALVAEAICRRVAENLGAIWFPAISCGLDMWRTEKDLEQWGFEKDEKIFGMNFPDLPLTSEYAEPEEFTTVVNNRLKAVKDSGFRHAFLVNGHGGQGQGPLIEHIAKEANKESFSVHALGLGPFKNSTDNMALKVGGHAGISETHMLMAFRPELADLSQLTPGELTVRHSGILHTKPVIEAEWNPVHTDADVARELGNEIIENMTRHVRELIA